MTITVVMLGKIVLFSYVKVKDIFGGIRTLQWGGQKEGVTGGMGEKPKMRVIFTNSHYSARYKLYLTNCWSDKTFNHHHCDQHAQKPLCRDFKVIFSSSSLSKTTC